MPLPTSQVTRKNGNPLEKVREHWQRLLTQVGAEVGVSDHDQRLGAICATASSAEMVRE